MPSVVVHLHLHQPPREDPWLGDVPRDPEAAPDHDLTARVERECYRALTAARVNDADGRVRRLVDTLARSSFDVAPALLAWLARERPSTYAAVLGADRAAQRHTGHGAALAHPYHHTILPLLSRRDKLTEVRWGLAEFRRRFGREAQGMWLPETAADDETLDVLAEAGVGFTVLAPHQVREVEGGGLPPAGRPGVVTTASGRTLAVFGYDEAIAHEVAFGGLLRDGRGWATRMRAAAAAAVKAARTANAAAADGSGAAAVDGAADGGVGALVAIASNAETYGHHHRDGDRALAAMFDALGDQRRPGRRRCGSATSRPSSPGTPPSTRSSWRGRRAGAARTAWSGGGPTAAAAPTRPRTSAGAPRCAGRSSSCAARSPSASRARAATCSPTCRAAPTRRATPTTTRSPPPAAPATRSPRGRRRAARARRGVGARAARHGARGAGDVRLRRLVRRRRRRRARARRARPRRARRRARRPAGRRARAAAARGARRRAEQRRGGGDARTVYARHARPAAPTALRVAAGVAAARAVGVAGAGAPGGAVPAAWAVDLVRDDGHDADDHDDISLPPAPQPGTTTSLHVTVADRRLGEPATFAVTVDIPGPPAGAGGGGARAGRVVRLADVDPRGITVLVRPVDDRRPDALATALKLADLPERARERVERALRRAVVRRLLDEQERDQLASGAATLEALAARRSCAPSRRSSATSRRRPWPRARPRRPRRRGRRRRAGRRAGGALPVGRPPRPGRTRAPRHGRLPPRLRVARVGGARRRRGGRRTATPRRPPRPGRPRAR
jgi:hypothetical protein